jgi:hypothetical protein
MDESGSQARISKRQTIIRLILALFLMIGCSSEEIVETSKDTSTASVATKTETTTPEAKVVEVELMEKEKKEIDKKLEKIKKQPIKGIIDNYQAANGYEEKQSLAALEEVLNRKLLVLLKKEFLDSKDVLELPIYNPSGDENYFKLALKDLFMIYFSQNPDNGNTITKEHLNLKRNKKGQTVALFMHPAGMAKSQEATFKVFNGKLILSEYRIGRQTNPTGYEYVVPQVFATISIQDNGFIPKLDYINQKLVDSIK